MSRTKRTQNKNVIEQKRHGIVRKTKKFTLTEIAALAKASGGEFDISKLCDFEFAGLDGLQRIEKIVNEARAFLEHRNLPNSDLVFNDPETSKIATLE